MISEIFDERWQAYTSAYVRMRHPVQGAMEVRPDACGRTSGEFPETSRTIHIMTAYNPGRSLHDSENHQRQTRLLSWLDSLEDVSSWPATGGDAAWTHCEESVAVVGLTDHAALELARRFDQEAIFAWTRDSWRVIACETGHENAAGWVLAHPG